MQKARRHPTKGLRPLVGARFQDLFHPLIQGTFHLSFTVLVHYRSLRSIQPYRMVPADSHKASPTSQYSGSYQNTIAYLYAAIMLYGRVSHPIPVYVSIHFVVLQPRICRNICGLGSFPFARHYSGNHYYFLFLCLLRCFSSARLRICNYPSGNQVSPFRNLRINSYLPIPVAYRSLSRLSSPLRAKASPVYPFLLSSTYTAFARYGMLFRVLSVLISSPGQVPSFP